MEAIEAVDPADDLAAYHNLDADDQERLRHRMMMEHWRTVERYLVREKYFWILICNIAEEPVQASANHEKQVFTEGEIAQIAVRLNRPMFGFYRREVTGLYTV